ncbi:ubiquitin-related modifier 1 [Dipodascopsis uninucleata]
MTIKVSVEYSGGLEILFGGIKSMKVELQKDSATILDLVEYLCKEKMTDKRQDLFVIDGYHIRPGILVLINDTDWEIEGEEEYVLRSGDQILFASTLHGG